MGKTAIPLFSPELDRTARIQCGSRTRSPPESHRGGPGLVSEFGRALNLVQPAECDVRFPATLCGRVGCASLTFLLCPL